MDVILAIVIGSIIVTVGLWLAGLDWIDSYFERKGELIEKYLVDEEEV